MKAFLDDDFLLTTPTARRLYQVARSMPILDYHCHLDPKEIAQDRRFENITQVWLGGDHYTLDRVFQRRGRGLHHRGRPG